MKHWLLLFSFLPLCFMSCGDDENDVFDGYRGSDDMTRDLAVDWGEAATKSSMKLVTDFVSAESPFFLKEIRWTEGSEAMESVKYTNSDLSVGSQLSALEALLDNYARTKDSNVLGTIETVLQAVCDDNGGSYVVTENTETAAMGLVLARLYEATQNSAYWTAAKDVFDALEESGETDIVEESDVENPYTNGKYGIPVSDSDDTRLVSANCTAAMMAIKMYGIAQSSGESAADKYRNFANNLYRFCTGALYEASGLAYTSAKVSETGAYQDQDKTYNSGNQAYMLGLCVSVYNMDKQTAALEYANTIANYQVKGTNNSNVWHQNYAVFYPSYGTGKIGTGSRAALLDNAKFLRYLKDLIQVTGNNGSYTQDYSLCLTNNVETMWALAQTNENCLWGATWYQPAYAGEYSGSDDDEWASKTVISLEAQVAGSILLEMKALF